MEVFAASIQGSVLSLVKRILERNAIDADVHPESRLVDIGLTSMEMVELMLKVEPEFDLTLPSPRSRPRISNR
jgi:acyl carrier protein